MLMLAWFWLAQKGAQPPSSFAATHTPPQNEQILSASGS